MPRQRLPLSDPLPEEFQAEVVLPYDRQRFPFLEALLDVLEETEGADLSRLHQSQAGREALASFRGGPLKAEAMGPRGNPWNRRFLSCNHKDPARFGRFLDAYHDFLRVFVLEHLQTSRVAFQTLPTFRCHLPGCGAPGRPHRDEDYFHPRCEVNFWVPLTPVFGSNSLYSESRRGSGDFHPFEASIGSVVRFYANQVWHYTAPNDTDSTRVSFDFRVVREQEWSPAAFAYFQLGGHYSVMTSSGLLPSASEELLELRRKFRCLPRPPGKLPTPEPPGPPEEAEQ